MRDERVIGGPAFRFKDSPDGPLAGRVRAEPVDRFGREDDQPPGANDPGGPLDRF